MWLVMENWMQGYLQLLLKHFADYILCFLSNPHGQYLIFAFSSNIGFQFTLLLRLIPGNLRLMAISLSNQTKHSQSNLIKYEELCIQEMNLPKVLPFQSIEKKLCL